MWIVNFARECRAWREVRKVCKQNQRVLDKVGLKTDWFGRIYKVINRDFSIALGTSEDESLLSAELKELSDVLIKLNIMDILAYELTPIESETENAYLVVFTPAWNLDRQYVTWWSVLLLTLGWMSMLAAIITPLVIIYGSK